MAVERMEGKLKSFDGTELYYRKDVPEKPKAGKSLFWIWESR